MPMVMMNHAAYPRTPGKELPASVSNFWIGEIVLRKRIGYRGIVLSDDLEMGGILKFMPIAEAAVAAVRAGPTWWRFAIIPSRSCKPMKRL